MMNMAEAVRALLFDEPKQKPKGVAMALARAVCGTCLFLIVLLTAALADSKSIWSESGS